MYFRTFPLPCDFPCDATPWWPVSTRRLTLRFTRIAAYFSFHRTKVRWKVEDSRQDDPSSPTSGAFTTKKLALAGLVFRVQSPTVQDIAFPMVPFRFRVFPSPRGIETFLRSRSGLRSFTLKVNSVDERPALSLQAWPESTFEPFQDRTLPHGTFVPGGLLAARSSGELTLRAESASFVKPWAPLTFRWSFAFGIPRSVDDGNEEIGRAHV